MLGKPEYGWSTFKIGESHSYSLSYLTDVACDWLAQAIHGLHTLEPFAVHGYCEPNRMVCLVSYYTCYVIFEPDGGISEESKCKEMYGVDLTMLDFCKALHADINRDLEEWVDWNLIGLEEDDDDEVMEENRKVLDERRKHIKDQLAELERLMHEKEELWTPNHGFF